MKILYLKLKNFATIYTAMQRKEIEIDFSKCKNHVILFVGKNGSGKTSILSTLHPFAYAGPMDNRNNTTMILDEEDGYKEIHIQDHNSIYKIKHFYKYSKRGTIVKSFVEKDGTEMNPNGNVTSFNEYIKNEFMLELDFLRLLRLGSNVSNLIDMKSTERKNFTSDLLSDINVYNELFKKVSEDNRVLRNMIKSVSDKIEKLNIIDEDLLKKDISMLESQIQSEMDKKDQIQKDIGSIDGAISILLPEGIDKTKDYLSSIEDETTKLSKELESLNKKILSICLVVTSDIDSVINDVISDKSRLESEINLNNDKILFYNEELSTQYNKLNALEEKERLYTSVVEYKKVTDLYIELTNKIDFYKKRFNNYIPPCTKDNLMTLLNALQQMEYISNKTMEFDKNAIKKTVELIRNGVNIDSYVLKEIDRVNKEILKATSKVKNTISKSPVILFKPTGCQFNDCPYLCLYDMIFNDTEESKGIITLETEKELLTTISDINKNISYIFTIVSSNKGLIDKSNIPFFSIQSILSHIEAGEILYDEDFITDMISEAEDYEDYLLTKTQIKEVSAEIKLMNSNKETIESLRTEKKNITDTIMDLTSKINQLKQTNYDIQNNKLRVTIDLLDQLNQYKEISSLILMKSEQRKELVNEINKIHKLFDSIASQIETKSKLTDDLKSIEWAISNFNKSLFSKKVAIREYETLTKERKQLDDQFDDVNVIREALSSNKGIPLLFIQLYLKNTKIYVNELLNIVYGEDFEIDDFDINANEFNIPYIKNGLRINDVSYASQGERSFISIALSFALIIQSIKKYNILLLDEIDSTLDTKNRAIFLNILEKQMGMIDAEQIFLITHNNMFDAYPVDIILTSGDKLESYSNANIIFSN